MNSKVTGEGADEEDEVQKKIIAVFTYKKRLLSIDVKTKVVQHVPRINLRHLNFKKFQISVSCKQNPVWFGHWALFVNNRQGGGLIPDGRHVGFTWSFNYGDLKSFIHLQMSRSN